MSFKTIRAGLGSLVFAVSVAVGLPAAAETAVGTTVESRVLLGFKVNEDAVGDMLPEGWRPVTLPRGPVAGSNLIVALIDRHLILDAEGAPEDPASGPIVALLAYGAAEGVEGVRGFVTRVYEEPPLVNPYGTSVAADIDRVSGFTDAGGGDRRQSEVWTIRPEAGGELMLDLDYKVGGFLWSTGGESRPYSPEQSDFYRIYRYDQLAGLAMNTTIGRGLDGSVSFAASDPDLAAMFDGSEALVSIISIPTYIRTISLP